MGVQSVMGEIKSLICALTYYITHKGSAYCVLTRSCKILKYIQEHTIFRYDPAWIIRLCAMDVKSDFPYVNATVFTNALNNVKINQHVLQWTMCTIL